MRLITKRDLIRTLPARYAHAFEHTPAWYREDWGRGCGGSGEQVYNRLRRLNLETCTEGDLRDIAAFLSGWIRVSCDSCHEQVSDHFMLGDDPYGEQDYDTFRVCMACVQKMATQRQSDGESK